MVGSRGHHQDAGVRDLTIFILGGRSTENLDPYCKEFDGDTRFKFNRVTSSLIINRKNRKFKFNCNISPQTPVGRNSN